jgi:hypothetical protein
LRWNIATKAAEVCRGTGWVNLAGPPLAVTTINNNTTLTAGQQGLVLVSGDTWVTLPFPSIGAGATYTIKKMDSANRVNIRGSMEGQGNILLSQQFDALTLVSDGTVWWVTAFYNSQPPDPQPPQNQIILYSTSNTHDGNLGGRSGADNLCRIDDNRPEGYSDYRAFITVLHDWDSIYNMYENYGVPRNLPIKSSSGTTIANNWHELTNLSITTSLAEAGVVSTPNQSDFWWSGSVRLAPLSIPSNCSGWSTGGYALPNLGTRGDIFTSSLQWIGSGELACGTKGYLLCVAY